MAHIEDRWSKTIIDPDGKKGREKTSLYGKGLRYRVRYIDPGGSERSRSFADKEKRQAEAFLVSIEADKVRGTYVDPNAGKITFRDYALKWLAAQTFDESTREVTERRLRRHIFPHIGGRSLGLFQPMHIRELDRELQKQGLSDGFRAVVYGNVLTVFNHAVDDGLIAKNPCSARTVRRPKVATKKIVPWTRHQVLALRQGMPERYALSIDLGAGCGMRQGEILGIAIDDFDFSQGCLHIERQLKIVGSRLVFALPKGRKTREVPLPNSVADAVKRHIEMFPPVAIALPWNVPGGKPTTANVIIYGKTKVGVDRNYFNEVAWHVALDAAGIERGREHGMHALRHFYASVLLDAGESIKALAKYLGHSDPAFTLRTYTHLMPTSEDRTRRAIDRMFSEGTPDSLDGLEAA